jgi:hypothetical protein
MATASPGQAVPPNYIPGPSQPHGHFQSLGDRWATLTPAKRIVIFVAALAAVILVVSLLGAGRQPPEPLPDCADPPCGPPAPQDAGNPAGSVVVIPAPSSTNPPLHLAGRWANVALGISLEFDPDIWLMEDRKDSVVLTPTKGADYSLYIITTRAADGTPASLEADRRTFLKGLAPDLTEEPDPERVVPGVAEIGLRPAHASILVGTSAKSLLHDPWTVVLMSAGDANASIVVQLVSADDLRSSAFEDTDPVVNSIRWR